MWSQLRRQFAPGFENILDKGVNDGLYDVNNPLEKYTCFTILILTSNYINSLLFRWLAIPWLQAELDAWSHRWNSSSRRADKHKILPRGIPDLIHAKPDNYNSKSYMVH